MPSGVGEDADVPLAQAPERVSEVSISHVEQHVAQLQKEHEPPPATSGQPQMGALASMLAQLKAEQAQAFDVPIKSATGRAATKMPAGPFTHLCGSLRLALARTCCWHTSTYTNAAALH